jgi:hypothetical protein
MLLQEADNFRLGTGIVSRLYMGETLVWPDLPSGNFWQFTNSPYCKRLSNFRVVYSNGNVLADWGDGNVSGIISGINYNHIFEPYSINAQTLRQYINCAGVGNFQTVYSLCSLKISDTLYADSNLSIPVTDGTWGTAVFPNVSGPYTFPTYTTINGIIISTGSCTVILS